MLRTEIEINGILAPGTITTTPYTPGTRNYNTNISSSLIRINAGEGIKIFRNYFPADSELLLSPDVNFLPVSNITFIKINADIP